MKITISLPDNVFELLEKSANETGINRSAYISMLISERRRQDDVLAAMQTLAYQVSKSDTEMQERQRLA